MRTRIFKIGGSLAVRIPRQLGFDGAPCEVDIVRRGDLLIIRPVDPLDAAATLAGVGDIFAMFSPGFMTSGREFHEQDERDWNPAPPDAD